MSVKKAQWRYNKRPERRGKLKKDTLPKKIWPNRFARQRLIFLFLPSEEVKLEVITKNIKQSSLSFYHFVLRPLFSFQGRPDTEKDQQKYRPFLKSIKKKRRWSADKSQLHLTPPLKRLFCCFYLSPQETSFSTNFFSLLFPVDQLGTKTGSNSCNFELEKMQKRRLPLKEKKLFFTNRSPLFSNCLLAVWPTFCKW